MTHHVASDVSWHPQYTAAGVALLDLSHVGFLCVHVCVSVFLKEFVQTHLSVRFRVVTQDGTSAIHYGVFSLVGLPHVKWLTFV